MPTVELRFTPDPAHVRTARLLTAAVGRRAGLDESLVDEVKLAVGEAVTRAVTLHTENAVTEDVALTIADDEGAFTVTVVDRGPSHERDVADVDPEALASGGDTPPGFGMAIIAGLVDDMVLDDAHPGTSVRLRWPLGPTS